MLEANSLLEMLLVRDRRTFVQVMIPRPGSRVAVQGMVRSGRRRSCLVSRLVIGLLLPCLSRMTSIGASPGALKEALRSAHVRMVPDSLSWSGPGTSLR
jgi:hypothetical protein